MKIPDIILTSGSKNPSPLYRVGMEGVELPVRIRMGDDFEHQVPARCNLYVNLAKPSIRGIHMSRLYTLAVDQLEKNELSFGLLASIAQSFIKSHSDMSTEAEISVQFEYMLPQFSLISENSGWRFYPTVFRVQATESGLRMHETIELTYSSTCPCSAELSKQALMQDFMTAFTGQENISAQKVIDWMDHEDTAFATPHSQRSIATVTVEYDQGPIVMQNTFIEVLEDALGTAVQTAVKREDEQEFARLNGQNLMFAEDAARVLKSTLEQQEGIIDFEIAIRHLESLHAHDAVVYVSKL